MCVWLLLSSSWDFLKKKFIYLRERESMSKGEKGREREKQTPH